MRLNRDETVADPETKISVQEWTNKNLTVGGRPQEVTTRVTTDGEFERVVCIEEERTWSSTVPTLVMPPKVALALSRNLARAANKQHLDDVMGPES